MLEKLAETMEEKEAHRVSIAKWTPLPPPNLELYLRKPVVLLNWDEGMASSSDELDLPNGRPKNDANTYDVIDVDSIADDDSFSDIDLSQLTARLEDAEKELSFLGSQDVKDSDVENQGQVIGTCTGEGGNEHIPPAPGFSDDGDDDEYGSGSDMDLFGDEDYDRLYDNVDQQLQLQGPDAVAAGEEDQSKGFNLSDFPLPALVEVGSQQHHNDNNILLSSSPICPQVQVGESDAQMSADVKPIIQQQQYQASNQQGESKTHQPRREGTSSSTANKPQRSMEQRTSETIHQFTDSTSGSCDAVDQPHTPMQQQARQDAPRARSSSSEYKFGSPDSDVDLPPVNWGRGSSGLTTLASSAVAGPSMSTPAGTSRSMHGVINDEHEQPRALHTSEDVLQAASTSNQQQPHLVAEKCPICNFSFPVG